MISDFMRIFDRNLEDFKKYENKKEIVEILFEAKKEENINNVVNLIRDDLLRDEGNIFNNLLYLFPFSSDIVEKVLESGFIEKKDLLHRLDIVFETTSNMGRLLTHIKKLVRDDNFAFSKIEENLNEVNKELKKYEEQFQKKKELQDKLKKINFLKNEVKDIKELESYIEKLRDAKSIIDKLKKEIDKSKRIFRDVCKDEV